MLSLFKKPKVGRRIEITWLPRNGGERNCYIGSKGVVHETKGGLMLRMDTAWLVGSGRMFCWKYI